MLTACRWDDNQLRSYLEEKGVIKTKSEKKRDELLGLMRDNYAKVANPVWEAWSDSYIVSHHDSFAWRRPDSRSLEARMAGQP